MNDPHATYSPAGGGASVVPISRPVETATLEYNGVRELDRRAVTRYAAAVPEESLMLTGDENIIDIRFVTFWVINDAQKFIFNIRNPEATVKAASEAAMREVVGRIDLEYARTRGRAEIQQQVQRLLQQILDTYGAGIQVTDKVRHTVGKRYPV